MALKRVDGNVWAPEDSKDEGETMAATILSRNELYR
jgi:hypothetical protein